VGEVFIDKTIPWSYFDGACQGDENIRGLGGLIYYNNNHFLIFKACLGPITNKFAKLMALHALMMVSLTKDIR
jgi:ribonuclease HI